MGLSAGLGIETARVSGNGSIQKRRDFRKAVSATGYIADSDPRTANENRLVNQMIFSSTHTREMPWIVHPPTNRRGGDFAARPSYSFVTKNWRMNTSTGIRRLFSAEEELLAPVVLVEPI
jgi:hypothetical protein